MEQAAKERDQLDAQILLSNKKIKEYEAKATESQVLCWFLMEYMYCIYSYRKFDYSYTNVYPFQHNDHYYINFSELFLICLLENLLMFVICESLLLF